MDTSILTYLVSGVHSPNKGMDHVGKSQIYQIQVLPSNLHTSHYQCTNTINLSQ